MVGIEIVYKKPSPTLIERKIKLLASMGWTVYTVNSENIYHIIEEYFRIRRKDKTLEWEDLNGDPTFQFVEKFHKKNGPCSLYTSCIGISERRQPVYLFSIGYN